MESNLLKQKDLVDIFGALSIASEVQHEKRADGRAYLQTQPALSRLTGSVLTAAPMLKKFHALEGP